MPLDFAPVSQLRDAIRDELETELTELLEDAEFGIACRYMPHNRREDLVNLQASVYIADANPDWFASGHQGDEDDFTIEVAFQQAVLSVPTNDNGLPDFDQIDNTVFLDQFLALVEAVKSMWRPEDENEGLGRLRNKKLAGCTFIGLQHDPIFEPIPLARLGVMSVVISLTYRIGF